MTRWLCLLLVVACKGPAPPADEAARIRAFWTWWAEARPRYESAGPEPSPELKAELERHVEAIHGGLAWAIGTDPKGVRALEVSPEGSFPLRRLTEAWARAAPADPRWRYLPARERQLEMPAGLTYEGHAVRTADFAFAIKPDEQHALLLVKVYHPRFASMGSSTTGAAFIELDTLLGEDDVERWIGGIDVVFERPDGAVGPAELRAKVDELAARVRGATQPRFAAFRVRGEGPPGLGMVVLHLKRLDHLDAVRRLELVISYLAAEANGLPAPAEHDAGSALEDEVVAALGPRAVHYGHLIRDGKLRVWFYAAPGDEPAVNEALDRWARSKPGRTIERTWSDDPEWKEYAKY